VYDPVINKLAIAASLLLSLAQLGHQAPAASAPATVRLIQSKTTLELKRSVFPDRAGDYQAMLQKRLEAEAQEATRAAQLAADTQARALPPQPAPAPYTAPTLPTSDAKLFIYMHESGNNPSATNAGGCYGLGQDCNGIVRNQCGADYACQDAYFEQYCTQRYGSWESAKQFWLANSWW
jgi:hypothetical protein